MVSGLLQDILLDSTNSERASGKTQAGYTTLPLLVLLPVLLLSLLCSRKMFTSACLFIWFPFVGFVLIGSCGDVLWFISMAS